MFIHTEKLSIQSNTSFVAEILLQKGMNPESFRLLTILQRLVLHTKLPHGSSSFFWPDLISPFVAPGQYSGFISQKSTTRKNIPFCCRLLPTNIIGNKQYRPRDESKPIDCFLPLRAEPFVSRQSVFLNQPTATLGIIRDKISKSNAKKNGTRHDYLPIQALLRE
ncbi:hypothetical protein G5I_10759 [Acromyrmex echinatior]|uniref:Uncharacterized protein n=1 Tax=Acromyrmex echinatior TaxID=103372 RepID=F4WXR9_ACREC|nr:hypothetical protein G5I_10759 [Acromyrmex echinatior]